MSQWPWFSRRPHKSGGFILEERVTALDCGSLAGVTVTSWASWSKKMCCGSSRMSLPTRRYSIEGFAWFLLLLFRGSFGSKFVSLHCFPLRLNERQWTLWGLNILRCLYGSCNLCLSIDSRYPPVTSSFMFCWCLFVICQQGEFHLNSLLWFRMEKNALGIWLSLTRTLIDDQYSFLVNYFQVHLINLSFSLLTVGKYALRFNSFTVILYFCYFCYSWRVYCITCYSWCVYCKCILLTFFTVVITKVYALTLLTFTLYFVAVYSWCVGKVCVINLFISTLPMHSPLLSCRLKTITWLNMNYLSEHVIFFPLL